jgi:hypothetical protein
MYLQTRPAPPKVGTGDDDDLDAFLVDEPEPETVRGAGASDVVVIDDVDEEEPPTQPRPTL